MSSHLYFFAAPRAFAFFEMGFLLNRRPWLSAILTDETEQRQIDTAYSRPVLNSEQTILNGIAQLKSNSLCVCRVQVEVLASTRGELAESTLYLVCDSA